MGRLSNLARRLVNGPAGGDRRQTEVDERAERRPDERLIRLDPLWRSAASEGQADTQRWLVEPTTGQPIAPRPQPGYYPRFHTLDQQSF